MIRSEHHVIDSEMTFEAAFEGLRKDCPRMIEERQRLIDVSYVGFDGILHRGQIVADESITHDLQALFEECRKIQFPFFSVIPLADSRFHSPEGLWDDHLSMEANNSSCFNYREIIGSTHKGLSLHALGLAFDINPRSNPVYGFTESGEIEVFPHGEKEYDPTKIRNHIQGALWKDHPVVSFLKGLGWRWGGDFTLEEDGLVDPHHFTKIPEGYPSVLTELLAPVIRKKYGLS